jgi:hypothetical protein
MLYETLKERNHSGNIGIDGRIIIDVREIGCDDANWILLAQGTDQRRALVNLVMIFWVLQKAGTFLNN